MYFAKYIHWNASSEFSRLWRAEWVHYVSKEDNCFCLQNITNVRACGEPDVPSSGWFPAPVMGTTRILTPSRFPVGSQHQWWEPSECWLPAVPIWLPASAPISQHWCWEREAGSVPIWTFLWCWELWPWCWDSQHWCWEWTPLSLRTETSKSILLDE